MLIKHKEVGELFHVTYQNWLRQYLQTGKFKNFTVHHPKDVVEIYVIDDKTGNLSFRMLADKSQADQIKNNDPRRFHIKNLEYKYYDRDLVPNEKYFELFPQSAIKPHILSLQSSKKSLKKTNHWYNLPSINTKAVKRTTSIISKKTISFITGVLIILVAYFIWALFGDQIVSFFK